MILEHVSQSLNAAPSSIGQYTALQIFFDFNDHPSNSRKYLIAAERHSTSVLIETYRRVKKAQGNAADFFVALEKH